MGKNRRELFKKIVPTVSHMVLYFFMYSIIGWLWETVYCSMSDGQFVFRGFLYGPYCPVYGVGVLSVLYFLQPYVTKNVFVLFLLSAFIVSVLEYYTGWGLEKFFHLRLWDYSRYFLNIDGLVCLPVSTFWGVCCVIIVKFIHPKVAAAVNALYAKFGPGVSTFIIFMMGTDLALSVLKALENMGKIKASF
ncbi:putative membrane protein [Elusimicrobium simillimum]|uniref:putative ABC transporter permease n=1 Tax=Elusimicrobium simillimum TaxID=3143438 RepID=UPI003C6EACB5